MKNFLDKPLGKKIRVMIVDDSAMVRKVLKEILSTDPEIEVIYAASNPYEARDFMVVHKPDVITLDIEMPKMDGVTFLKKYMRIMPTPTIIISSLAEQGRKITIEALEAGAVDIITKPKIGLSDFFDQQVADIVERVKAASKAKVQLASELPSNNSEVVKISSLEETTDKVIAIGASTGGVEHLSRIMPLFPATSPGVVIVQHMPEGFTASFAKRLNELSAMQVKEAQDGDRILPGLVLLAPGGKHHMSVYRSGGQYRVKLKEGEKVSFNRPAVDVLFESVADAVGKNCASVLMTGMGKDGAQGLLKIRQAGGKTFIQNEATCVIYGMPGEADRIGAASAAVSLLDIPNCLLKAFKS